MTTALPNVAVVLGGGTGSRVGLATPKQLIKVAGRTILEHTLAALHDCAEIDEMIVMMTPDFLDPVERLRETGRFPKITQVLEGGVDRNDTTRRAIEALGDRECNVLFHDAVRPLVDCRIVRDCVEALQTYRAVDVAIPSADTIIEVDDDDTITAIPARARLRRGQTPQGFRLSTIRDAYGKALADPDFTATDDCTVVLKYLPAEPIKVVLGSEQNMKVTHPIDIYLADKLFQLASRDVPSFDAATYRARLADQVIVVFGGSYGIGAEIVNLARRFGATAYSFSRSDTGTNIADPDDVANALSKVHAEAGRIDAVVTTAAVLERGNLDSFTTEQVEDQLRVNLLAPIEIARQSRSYLAETRGHLVFFTSSSYTRGRAGYSLYSAAKAGVVNLTQALADEWSTLGVHVNCVNPERTRTPMRVAAFGEEDPSTLLTAADVAYATVDVLLSNTSGHVIDVRRHEEPRPA